MKINFISKSPGENQSMIQKPHFRTLTPSLKSMEDLYWFAEQYNWGAYPCQILPEADYIVQGITEVQEIRYFPNQEPLRVASLLIDTDRDLLRIPMGIVKRILQAVNDAHEHMEENVVKLSAISCEFDVILCSRRRGNVIRVSPLLLLLWIKLIKDLPNLDNDLDTPEWQELWAGLAAKIQTIEQENQTQAPDPSLSLELVFPVEKTCQYSFEWLQQYLPFIKEVWVLSMAEPGITETWDELMREKENDLRNPPEKTGPIRRPLFGFCSFLSYTAPYIEDLQKSETKADTNTDPKARSQLPGSFVWKDLPNPFTPILNMPLALDSLEWRWVPIYLEPTSKLQFQILHDYRVAVADQFPTQFIPYLRSEYWPWKPFQSPVLKTDSGAIASGVSIVDPSHFHPCPPQYLRVYSNLLQGTIITSFRPDPFNELGQFVPNHSADFLRQTIPELDAWRYKFMHFYLQMAGQKPLQFIESYNQYMLFQETDGVKYWILVRFMNQANQHRDYPFPLQTSILLLTRNPHVKLFSVEIDRGIYREEDPDVFFPQLELYWEEFRDSLKTHFEQINRLRGTYLPLDLVMHRVVTSGFMTQHYVHNSETGLLKAILQVWQYNEENQTFEEMTGKDLRTYKNTVKNEMDPVASGSVTENNASLGEDARISAGIAALFRSPVEKKGEFSLESNMDIITPQNPPVTKPPINPADCLQPFETIFHIALRGVEDPASVPLQATFMDPTMFQQNRSNLPEVERVWEIRYDLASLLNDRWMLKQMQLLPGQILQQVLVNATGDPPIHPGDRPTDPKVTRNRNQTRFQRATRNKYPQQFFTPTLRRSTLKPLTVENPEDVKTEKIILLHDTHPLSALSLDQRTKITQVYRLEWRETSPATMKDAFHHRRKMGYSKRLSAIKATIAHQQQNSKSQSLEPFLEYLHYKFDTENPHTVAQLAEVFQVPPSTIFQVLTTVPPKFQPANSMIIPRVSSMDIISGDMAPMDPKDVIADYLSAIKAGAIYSQITDRVASSGINDKLDEKVDTIVQKMLLDYHHTIIHCPADHTAFVKAQAQVLKIPAVNVAHLIYESGVHNPKNKTIIEQIEDILQGLAKQDIDLLTKFDEYYPPQVDRTLIHDLARNSQTPSNSTCPPKQHKSVLVGKVKDPAEIIDTSSIEDETSAAFRHVGQQYAQFSKIRNQFLDYQQDAQRQLHPKQPYNHLANIIDGIEQYFRVHTTIDPTLRGLVEFRQYLLEGARPALLSETFDPADPKFDSNLEALYDLYMAQQWMHHYFLDAPNSDVQQRVITFLALILHEDQDTIKIAIEKRNGHLWEEIAPPMNRQPQSNPGDNIQVTPTKDFSIETHRVLPVKWDVAQQKHAPELMNIMETMTLDLQMPMDTLQTPIKMDKVPLVWSKETRIFKMKVANLFTARSTQGVKEYFHSRREVLAQIPNIEDKQLFKELYQLLHSDSNWESLTSAQIEPFESAIKTFFTQFTNTTEIELQLSEIGKWMQEYLQLRNALYTNLDIYPIIKSGIELLFSHYFYRRTEKHQGFMNVNLDGISADLMGLNTLLHKLFGFEYAPGVESNPEGSPNSLPTIGTPSKEPSLGEIGDKIRTLFLGFIAQYDQILHTFQERSEQKKDTRYYHLWKDRREEFSRSLANSLLRLCYRRPLGDLCANSKNSLCIFCDPEHTEDLLVLAPSIWEDEKWQNQWDKYLKGWTQAVFDLPSVATVIPSVSPSLQDTLTKTEVTLFDDAFDDASERGLIRAFKSLQLQDTKLSGIESEDEEELDEVIEERLEEELDQEIGVEDLEEEAEEQMHPDAAEGDLIPPSEKVQINEEENGDTEDTPETFKRTEIQHLSHQKIGQLFQYCSRSLKSVENFLEAKPHSGYEILAEQNHRLLTAFCQNLVNILRESAFPVDFSHFAIVSRVKTALDQYEKNCRVINSNQNLNSRKNILIRLENHLAMMKKPEFQSKLEFLNTHLWTGIDSYTWKEANLFPLLAQPASPQPLYRHSSKILAKTQEWLVSQQEILGKIAQNLIALMDPVLDWGREDPKLLTYSNTPKEKNEAAAKYFTPLRQLEEILILPIGPCDDPELTKRFEVQRKGLQRLLKLLISLKESHLYAKAFQSEPTVKQKDIDHFNDIERVYGEILPLVENFKDLCNSKEIYQNVAWPRFASTALQTYREKYRTFKEQEKSSYPQYIEQLRKDISAFQFSYTTDEKNTVKDYRPIIYLIRILKSELKEIQHKTYLLFLDDNYSLKSVPFNNPTLKMRITALGSQITCSNVFSQIFGDDISTLIYSNLDELFSKDPSILFPVSVQTTIQQKQLLQKKRSLYSELIDLIKRGSQELLPVLNHIELERQDNQNENKESKSKVKLTTDFLSFFGNPFKTELLFPAPSDANLMSISRKYLSGKILDIIRLEKTIQKFLTVCQSDTFFEKKDALQFPSLDAGQFYRWKNYHRITLRKKKTPKPTSAIRTPEMITAGEDLNSVFRNVKQLQWMTGQITRWSGTKEDSSFDKELKNDEELDPEEEDISSRSSSKIPPFYRMTQLNPTVSNFSYVGNDPKPNLQALVDWYTHSKTPDIITDQSERARKYFASVREIVDRYHLTSRVFAAEDVSHLKALVQADLRQYDSLNLSYSKKMRIVPADFALTKWKVFQDVIHTKTKSKVNKQIAKFVATGLRALLRRPSVGNCSYLENFARQLNEIPITKEFPEYTENTWIQRMDRKVAYSKYYVIEYKALNSENSQPMTTVSTIKQSDKKTNSPEYYCIYSLKAKASEDDSYLFFGYHLGKHAQNSGYYKELQNIFLPLPPDVLDPQYKILRYDSSVRTTPIVCLINEFVAKFALLDRHLTNYKSPHEILYHQAFQNFDLLGILQQLLNQQPFSQEFAQRAVTDSIQKIMKSIREEQFPNLQSRIQSLIEEIETLKSQSSALKKALRTPKSKVSPLNETQKTQKLEENQKIEEKLKEDNNHLKTLQHHAKEAAAMEQDEISGSLASMLENGKSFASVLEGNMGNSFKEKIVDCINRLFSDAFHHLIKLNPTLSKDQVLRYITDFSLDEKVVAQLKAIFDVNPRMKPYWTILANYRTLCEYTLRLRILEAEIREKLDRSFSLSLKKSFIENIFQIIQFVQVNASGMDIDMKSLFPSIGELFPEMFFTLVQMTCEIEELDVQDRHSLSNAFKFPHLKIDANGNILVLQPFTRVACTPTSNAVCITKVGGDQGVKTLCTAEGYSELQQRFVRTSPSSETLKLEKNLEQKNPLINPYNRVEDYKTKRATSEDWTEDSDWMNIANVIGKWEVRKTLQCQRKAAHNRANYQQLVRKNHLARTKGTVPRAVHRIRGTRFRYAQCLNQKQKDQNTSIAHFMATNFIRFAEDTNSSQMVQADSATLARFWKEWFGTRPFAQKEMMDSDLNRIREYLKNQLPLTNSDNDRMKRFAQYFEKFLISDATYCNRTDLIEQFIKEELISAFNQCCRITLEDLRRYLVKAGESFVLEKASWLRGLFAKYVKECARLKSLNMQLIPPEYTSKIANSTGHEGVKGFYVKILPIHLDEPALKSTDDDYLILILDSAQFWEEKAISDVNLEPLTSLLDKFKQAQIPIEKIIFSNPFSQIIENPLFLGIKPTLNQFLKDLNIPLEKSGKSLFQDAQFISDYPLSPMVRKKIIRQYNKENNPSEIMFVPAGSGNLLCYKNAKNQILILDRDVNAARNIAQYFYWKALRDICQLQIDRLINKPLKGDKFDVKYTGSVSKAQTRLQTKTKDAFTKLLQEHQFITSKTGSLRDHFELIQMRNNPPFITQFVETMEQALLYMIPRTRQKITPDQWAEQIRNILSDPLNIMDYPLQATQFGHLTAEGDPNYDTILHFLYTKNVVTEDWPTLLHANSRDIQNRRLSLFITGMWRGLIRSTEISNHPEKPIRLTAMLRAIHKEIFQDSSSIVKKKALAKYILNFEKWFLPLIKEIPDPPP